MTNDPHRTTSSTKTTTPAIAATPRTFRARLSAVPRSYFVAALLIFGVDQLTKYVGLTYVGGNYDHVAGPLWFANLYDPRSSLFGIHTNHFGFIVVYVSCFLFAITLMAYSHLKIGRIGGTMILGAGFGNFVSLMFNPHGVPNFICYNLWYYCNLADVTVFSGCVLTALYAFSTDGPVRRFARGQSLTRA